MKLQTRSIAGFLKKPDPCVRAILVYGPEESLVRERAAALGKTVVNDLSDPFSVSVLQGPEVAERAGLLIDEALAIPMFGGRRLLRLENAVDANAVVLKEYLKKPNDQTLVVAEAGALGPKSSLRKLFESAENAAALPCYVEGAGDVQGFLRELFSGKGLQAEPDAVAFLADMLAGDRGRIRGEIEKLSLYKGADASPLTLAQARECCGDSALQTLDDLCYATGDRDAARALRALAQLESEGTAPIAMLRTLQNHFRRLHLTKSRMAAGESADFVMKSLQPPIFFKQESAFRAQLSRWPMESLERVLLHLMDIEARSKTTGAPVTLLMERAALEICGAVRRAAA